MTRTESPPPPIAPANQSIEVTGVRRGRRLRRRRRRFTTLALAFLLVCVAAAGVVLFTTDRGTPSPKVVPKPTHVSAAGGVVSVDNSRANCIDLSVPNGVLTQSQLSGVEGTTGVTFDCLEVFTDQDPLWSNWVNPWATATQSDGWDSWLAASSRHQIVLGQQLIPDSECTTVCADPLTWEDQCAAGAFDKYATQLGQNLVKAGAGNSVIRLGKEFNGDWENDWIGTTTAEQLAWAKCFDNEVTAMRSVAGAHFLFDWNPAACDAGFSLSDAYPGDAYVDIIGIDAYDTDCESHASVAEEGWLPYLQSGGEGSIASIMNFARVNGKPISFPEWGLVGSDDPTYVDGIASIIATSDVAYQSYFDCGCDNITPLGSGAPNSLAAYKYAFGG